MEKFTKPRRFAALVAFGIGSATLAGCANYSGEGNEFVIEGRVLHAGKQSLTVDVTDINETHGDASGWFDVGNKSSVHDNCDCHGFWNSRKQYGVVLDYSGVEIEPNDVPEGTCVELTGKIRDDQDGKYSEQRPVYDVAQVIPCG